MDLGLQNAAINHWMKYLPAWNFHTLRNVVVWRPSAHFPHLVLSRHISHPGISKRQFENQSTCPKFVVVMRNPKDIITSLYHFHKSWAGEFAFPKHWGYFFGMFQGKRLLYGDFFDHIKGWWNYRHHPRVLFMRYEDMMKDAREILRKSRSFWGLQNNLLSIWKRLYKRLLSTKWRRGQSQKNFATHSV